jgi:ATP-dependent RNA helicase RhlE
VLAPTRELAAQVLERFCAYGRGLNVRAGLVIGGASINKQKAMARSGVDIIVATPGRLVDLIDQGALSIGGVETFVLDEVDQMLDLGFIHAIRAIAAKLPAERQNVFLSATIPTAIARLAAGLLRDPARVEISAKEPLKIEQSVMLMESGAKPAALFEVVRRKEFTRGLIFTRTKRGADKVVRALNSGGAPAFAIHGNRSQGQREQALNAFRSGKARILVATDIAARGIDITGVSHVINYDLPDVPETYVHRIGRTARAGATGVAISFCSHEERGNLRSIERLTRQTIAVAGGASHDDAARETARPRKNKGDDNGERGTARIRRRRHRGSAGRGLSRAAG